MKDLNFFVEECKLDIESLGIELGDIVSVTVNTRAAKRWGQCRKTGGRYYITISDKLLADDIDDESLKNTVAHELLHTIKDGMKHTGGWLKAATQLNNAYGYNIKRCSSAEEKGVTNNDKYRYQVTCKACGISSYYLKECKVVKCVKMGGVYDRYRCRCGGRLKVVDLF